MRPLILISLLTACAPTLEGDFAAELTNRGGCADVKFYAVDDDDSKMLSVWVEGLVEAATTAGETQTTTYDLPDPDVELIVEVGSKVSDATCDDVIENGGPAVDATFAATDGKATITIVPGETTWDARGTLTLEDVTFEGGGHIESFEIADTSVGWLAG